MGVKGGDESLAADDTKNKEMLPLDEMSNLSLNDNGQQTGAEGGVPLNNSRNNNKENAPPLDLNRYNGSDGSAEIKDSIQAPPPKTLLARGTSDGRPVKIILTGLSVDKMSWRRCDRPPGVRLFSERPLAPAPRATSIVAEDSDASNGVSAKINGNAGAAPLKTCSNDCQLEVEFTGLSIGSVPWRTCNKPPKIGLSPKHPPPSSTRDPICDEEDFGQRLQLNVSDDEDVDTNPVPRGPVVSSYLAKQRSSPYGQSPSPRSASDQTSSPGPSSDMSRSPIYKWDNSQSPSPIYKSDNSQSPSPIYKSDNSQSPSPIYKSDNSQSPSPIYKSDNLQSPSPIYKSDNLQSPSPIYKSNNLQSPSPIYKSNNLQSPSPIYKSDNLQSPSPIYKSDNSQSPSPEFAPRVHAGVTGPMLNVPCISSRICNGGSYSVNKNMTQGEKSSSAASSFSPPLEAESTLNARMRLAGCTILPGEPAAKQQPGVSIPVVGPPLTISTVADLLSISPHRDASTFPGLHREQVSSPQSILSFGSPLTDYSNEYSPSMVSSPEDGSELDVTFTEIFSSMSPYTSLGPCVDVSSSQEGIIKPEGQQATEDLNYGKASDEVFEMLQHYDIGDFKFDESIYDAAGIVNCPEVDLGFRNPSPSQNHSAAIKYNPPPLTACDKSVLSVPLNHFSMQNGLLASFGTAFNTNGAQAPVTFVVPKVDVVSASTAPAQVPLTGAVCSGPPIAPIPKFLSVYCRDAPRCNSKPAVTTVDSKIEQRMKEFIPIQPRLPSMNMNNPCSVSSSSTQEGFFVLKANSFPSSAVQICRASSGNTVGADTLTADQPKVHATYGEEYLILSADEDGDTNLHIAVANNNVELTRAIVERNGSNKSCIDVRNNKGQTPLFTAVFVNNPELTKYLLQNGAEPNSSCKDGTTPLHLLAMRGPAFQEVGQILCQVRDIPLNNRNNKGFTALHLAVKHHSQSQNMMPFISMLLRHGADLSFTEPCSNETALHMAVERGLPEVVSVICDSCTCIAATISLSSYKGTALHYAAMLSNASESVQSEIIETLLRYGGNRSVRSNYLGNKYPKDLVCGERKKVKDLLKLIRR